MASFIDQHQSIYEASQDEENSVLSSPICGQYIYSRKTLQSKLEILHIDYVDQQTLGNFIDEMRNEEKGLLQKFIQPGGNRNSIPILFITF